MSIENLMINYIERSFVNMTEQELRTKLQNFGIKDEQLKEIMDAVQRSREKLTKQVSNPE